MRFIFTSMTLASAAICQPALAQSEQFGLSYRVERLQASDLDLEACVAAADSAATAIGYRTALTKIHPDQLGVYSAAAPDGAGSLMVYCIAVDDKTTFLVQAMDYDDATSPEASAAADSVGKALLAAAR